MGGYAGQPEATREVRAPRVVGDGTARGAPGQPGIG